MSNPEKILLAQKMPDGAQIKISKQMKSLLENYKIKPEDGWAVIPGVSRCTIEGVRCPPGDIRVVAKGPFTVQLCLNEVKCDFNIGIMVKKEIGDMVHLFTDISYVEDPVCICPEGDCPGMIGLLEPGIFIKDSSTYISFEKILEKVPKNQRKAFSSMLEKMKREK